MTPDIKLKKEYNNFNDQNVKIKFKKRHGDAKLPQRNHWNDTGYDIYCVENKLIKAKSSAVVATGIDVAYISPFYWFKIEARSGMGFKHGIQPHFGIIDEPYRAGLGVKLYNLSNKDYEIEKGDRIAQLVIYERIDADLSWSDKIEKTNRGKNGFGSSGN